MTANDAALHRLAGAAGVAIDWIDAWGEPQRVSPGDLTAVLEALLGSPLRTVDAIDDARRSIEAQVPVVDPVIVAWDGRLPEVTTTIDLASASIVLEDDSEIPCTVEERTVACDRTLPIGYHRLVLDGGVHHAHVFSAPVRATHGPEHVSGLIAPMYSLRGEVDPGIGE